MALSFGDFTMLRHLFRAPAVVIARTLGFASWTHLPTLADALARDAIPQN